MSSPAGAQISPGLRTIKIVFSGSVWKYSPSSTCVPSVSSTTRTGSTTPTQSLSRPGDQSSVLCIVHRHMRQNGKRRKIPFFQERFLLSSCYVCKISSEQPVTFPQELLVGADHESFADISGSIPHFDRSPATVVVTGSV